MEELLPRRRWTAPAWPYRPRPCPDELLTSYLLRVAAGLDLAPARFLSATWGSSRSLLNQDLDNFAPPRVAKRIAEGTGITRADVRNMTLAAYAGALFTNHNSGGRNNWLLPTTIKSNDRRRPGLQYCPICLATDAAPYFRKRWRLAFATICTIHAIMLRDGCPWCGSVVHTHRAQTPTQCFRCGESLCVPSIPVASGNHVVWQHELELAAERGWIFLAGEPVRAHFFFAVVRQIAALLVNGPRAAILREVVARDVGGDAAPFEKLTTRQPIEYLMVRERHRLFGMVHQLMHGWPIKFVHACQEAGICRSHAIKDMPEPPFIYEQVTRSYLDATPYHASEPEVAAAAAWLRRTKGIASYSDLRSICGESRAAIYKHMDYQRHQTHPSQRRVEALSVSDGLF